MVVSLNTWAFTWLHSFILSSSPCWFYCISSSVGYGEFIETLIMCTGASLLFGYLVERIQKWLKLLCLLVHIFSQRLPLGRENSALVDVFLLTGVISCYGPRYPCICLGFAQQFSCRLLSKIWCCKSFLICSVYFSSSLEHQGLGWCVLEQFLLPLLS